jgi:hypothetical protein
MFQCKTVIFKNHNIDKISITEIKNEASSSSPNKAIASEIHKIWNASAWGATCNNLHIHDRKVHEKEIFKP